MKRIEKIYTKYYKKFDNKEKAIIRKYYHSRRVMNLTKIIARKHKFNKYDIQIAMVIGLLHDYGRFEQWTKYKTYKDFESVDHASLGVKLLKENNEIEKYWKRKADYDEIFDAIENHNKLKIALMSNHNEKLSKAVRDADKLDIFYLASIKEIPNNIYCVTSDKISEKIQNGFDNKTAINVKDVKNKNDEIIYFIAMVFDINYSYSFKYLYKYDLINKIYNNIENKEKIKPYFDEINKYIKEMKNK